MDNHEDMDNPEEPNAPIRIRAAIEAFQPAGMRPGPVWIACSGGIDSTALAFAARGTSLANRPLGLVHVDHGVHERRHEARDFVAGLANDLGLRFRSFEIAPGHGRETDLRTCRYALFRRLAEEDRATAVLLAHHLDDQLETVLFRLRRGAGTRGLAGIPERRPLTAHCELWRPLLTVRRVALERLCDEHDLAVIEDPTNRSLGPARNRLRHVEIPRLRARHRHFDARLLALQQRARARNDRLEHRANSILEAASPDDRTARRRVPLTALRSLDEATALEVHRQVCVRICEAAVPTDLLRRVQALARSGRRGRRVEAHPRLSVRHDGEALVFEPRSGALPRL